MSKRFFICRHCGNLVGIINDAGVPIMCCGKKMEALEPNSTDASKEKHLPCVNEKSGKIHVNIGAIEHPMTEEHHIQWIYLETEKGGQRKNLMHSDKPEASFCTDNDKPVAVYAYCNIHGLWKSEIE